MAKVVSARKIQCHYSLTCIYWVLTLSEYEDMIQATERNWLRNGQFTTEGQAGGRTEQKHIFKMWKHLCENENKVTDMFCLQSKWNLHIII